MINLGLAAASSVSAAASASARRRNADSSASTRPACAAGVACVVGVPACVAGVPACTVGASAASLSGAAAKLGATSPRPSFPILPLPLLLLPGLPPLPLPWSTSCCFFAGAAVKMSTARASVKRTRSHRDAAGTTWALLAPSKSHTATRSSRAVRASSAAMRSTT
ncbi:hypothetical protein M885DRAFT_507269 [Pelagophyceae sp. CCMP2097]|nr:hypothetical protein M885DRAFT_507269 [Pelagophyceae sp. CCMP2097]